MSRALDRSVLSRQGKRWLRGGVSVRSLQLLGACADQVAALKGRTRPLTARNVRWAVRKRLDLGWWASHALTAPAWRAHDEAQATARRAYGEATAPAWRAHDEAQATARRAYGEATATARRAYDEAQATAWRAHEEATATARRAYHEAQATAQRAYDEAQATALIAILWPARLPGVP